MKYLNAAKRIDGAPRGSDPRSADRVSLLCRALSLPLKGMTAVSVFGESGKSACIAMLSRALFSRGYRVGALTTPFSHNMTECIAVDCEPITMDDFASCVSRVLEAVNNIRAALAELSARTEEEGEAQTETDKALRAYLMHEKEFEPFSDELLLVASLLYFAEQGCRVILVEIPCGQRAGAYRLPLPTAVSVITAVSSAKEAAQICRHLDKRTRETVTALQDKSVYSIISDACVKLNCRLSMPLRGAFYPMDFAANRMRFFYKNVERTLHSGAYYQALNMLTASEVLEALNRQGVSVDPLAVDFQAPTGNAGLELQFSFLSLHPTVITDFTDTEARVKAFAESLSYQRGFLGETITVLVQEQAENTLADELLLDIFRKNEFSVDRILRATEETVRKTLKQPIKEISKEHSLLILGSRPFVYEAARAFYSLFF